MTPDRPRLIVLGTGFGAFSLVKNIGREFDVTVISPRNHFLFTPLLPSTTVGTIEFRSIIEPIRYARRDIRFLHANAHDVHPAARAVSCVGAMDGLPFTLEYDVLVIAVGAVSNTFGVPGVAEHALFLKELYDARKLRQEIIRCFERANLPGRAPEERSTLLHFVICGGGPTGVEVAAEISDFLMEDLRRPYPHLVQEARITVVEALKEILNTFDEKLRSYALDAFRRNHIRVLTESPVTRVEKNTLTLQDGSTLTFGLLLWSTGNGPTPFAERVSLPKDNRSRFLIDRFFRVKEQESIHAIGDCAILSASPLPATAQVAQQQGKYLADLLTRIHRGRPVKPFTYKHLGMLAYVGGNKALADLSSYKGAGWFTWIFWRSAYLTRIVSMKNKVKVLFDWTMARLFGRDISQF